MKLVLIIVNIKKMNTNNWIMWSAALFSIGSHNYFSHFILTCGLKFNFFHPHERFFSSFKSAGC